MYNFDDIKITEEEIPLLEENLENITVSLTVSSGYHKVFISQSMTIDPQLGQDKCYKYLRQQVKYKIQQGLKDIEQEYWKR